MDGTNTLVKRASDRAKKAMLSGAYGEETREFFIENPDGFVPVLWYLYQCSHCGNLSNDAEMSLYRRIDDESETGSDTRDILHLSSGNYKLVKRDEKYCSKCGSVLEKVTDYDHVNCPECGHLLVIEEWGSWS